MSARMRVLMTADTLGGVFTYAVELARALGARGVETVLATMGAPLSDAQRDQVDDVEGLTIVESDYRLEWMPGAWHDVDAAGEWLLALARRVRADIVHVNGFAHASVDFGVPVVCVAHSCVCSWWRAVFGSDAPAEWDTYRQRVRAGILAADAVVAPTRAALEQILACYDCPPLGRVIENGRRPDAFAPDEEMPIIVGAGRLWDAAKNLIALDACASALPWPVLVAGSSTNTVGDSFEASSVGLLGTLEPRALAGWLGRAAIFCSPARYEPFGLSILEAALSECALVLGDIPTLREVWGDAALYVRPEDHAGLRQLLLVLIANRELRRTYARRARERAARFSAHAMGRRYHALYDELLGGKVPRRAREERRTPMRVS